MNDLKPFKHGEEGTHAVCNKHNLGGKSMCCECSGKTDCSDTPNHTPEDKEFRAEVVKILLGTDMAEPSENAHTPEEGKYIGEYPVPIRMIADRVTMRGAKLENHDIPFIEEEINKLLKDQATTILERVKEMKEICPASLGEACKGASVAFTEMENYLTHLINQQ